MKIYNYKENTHEYTGCEDALLDILETKKQGKDVFLIPARATMAEPLMASENEVNVFVDGHWEVKKDYRGLKQIDVATQYISEIEFIGDLEENCFVINDDQIMQLNDYTFAVAENNQLVIRTSLDILKRIRSDEINQKRIDARKNEAAEFKEDLFDIDETSVSNLTGMAVLAGVNPNNVFLYRSKSNVNHSLSSEEIIALSAAVTSKVDSIYRKSWHLKELIDSANTIDDVLQICW